MNDRAARIAILLGIIPLAPWVAIAFGMAIDASRLGVDSLQWACGIGSVVIAGMTLWLWRRYVRWNGRRRILTGLITILLIGHIVVWQPIWNVSGCVQPELLLTSQSVVSAGLWWLLCPLIWWGWLLAVRRPCELGSGAEGRKRMSPDAARLTIGLSLVPMCIGLAFFTSSTLDFLDVGTSEWQEFISTEVVAATALVTWLLVWRRRVRWTRLRVWLSAILAAQALIVPVASLPNLASSYLEDLGDFSILLGLSIWMIGTAIVWRSRGSAHVVLERTADEDLHNVIRCGNCEYPLVGLRQVVCPECGWTATVDDVVRRAIDQIAEIQGQSV